MASGLTTIVIRAKSTTMGGPSRYLTREEAVGALQAVHLLTRPYRNVCELVAQLTNDVYRGAIDPVQAQLTYTPKVVTGLATLQSAVQDLSRAYIAHTNTVIGKGTGSSLELLNFANPLGGENGLFSGRVATPAPVPEQGEVKKRKRAPHDKNAPKRPITPYFLYMSYAREGIARDMGFGASAKQVADEGTQRWNSMGDEEKQVSSPLAKLRVRNVDMLNRNGNIFTAATMPHTRRRSKPTKRDVLSRSSPRNRRSSFMTSNGRREQSSTQS